MAIKIITDSTSEISTEEAKKMGIRIVPLKTVFADGEYRDGIDLQPEEFYEKLATAKQLPTTSQPTPYDFEKVFREEQANGNAIVAVLISASLSGTVQSALLAKEVCGGDIAVVDSENAAIGLRILVHMAVALRDAGQTVAEMVQILETEKKKIRLYAALDTLEYLQRGGRLSKTVAFAGTLLGLKPIVCVAGGVLGVKGKARGMQKAYDELYKLVNADGGIDFLKPVCLGYTGSPEPFKKFVKVSEQYLAGHTPIISAIGSVIGTHAGPGVAAIAYFKRK